MNTFEAELRELIEKYLEMPGYTYGEIVDTLEEAADKLVQDNATFAQLIP